MTSSTRSVKRRSGPPSPSPRTMMPEHVAVLPGLYEEDLEPAGRMIGRLVLAERRDHVVGEARRPPP